MVVNAKIIVWALALILLSGCGEQADDKNPFRPPIWGEPPGNQMVMHEGSLQLQEDLREGRFDEGRFQGFLMYGGAFTSVSLSLRRLDGQADPVLIVYGPRQDGEIWGRHVAFDDDGGQGGGARISRLRLPSLGEYLVLVTSYDGLGQGRFELSVGCDQGCEVAACQALECHESDACMGGFKNDARGCRSCDCVDQCMTSADCGPAQICVDGQCRNDCTCSGDLAEVCGGDGITYANECEARCLGVEVVNFEPCAASCAPLECGLSCVDGFVLDREGCPTCACQSPCEVCDERIEPVCTRNGVTYTNECQALCHGEIVSYAGRCNPECGALTCGLDCQTYRRDGRGCEICACEMTVCPPERAPVCGLNGVTYNNLCEAERAGAPIAFEGICPPSCEADAQCPQGSTCEGIAMRSDQCDEVECERICVRSQAPTRCERPSDCLSGFVCTEGICTLPCNCSPVYSPVCGVDGLTYFNACVARCASREVASVGACCDPQGLDACDLRCENGFALDGDGCDICQCREAPPCECEPVVNPVCGSDGQTHRNPCEARCVGVQWGEGACGR